MTVDIYWRIAMEGESSALRYRTATRGGFAPHKAGNLAPSPRVGEEFGSADYMAEVVRATEASGFVGGLMPSFPQTDDPWAAASMLAPASQAYRFMIAFQPGFLHPVQAARMSATLQAATGGRVVYNIISGGGGAELVNWTTPPEKRGPFGGKVIGFSDMEFSKDAILFRHIDAQGRVIHAFRKTPDGKVEIFLPTA